MNTPPDRTLLRAVYPQSRGRLSLRGGSAGLDWFVDRGVIHYEGAQRSRAQAAADPAAGKRELARIQRVRASLREVADSIAEQRAPKVGALETVNRWAGQPLLPAK